jgi:hypothetical protein
MTEKIIGWSIIGSIFALGLGILIYGILKIIEDWNEK